jgi:hypothetical protein
VLIIGTSMIWRQCGRPNIVMVGAVLGSISVASLVLSVWQSTANLPWAYFGLHARAWELGIGGLAALAAPRLARLPSALAAAMTWVGLVGIAVSAFWYDDTTVFPGYAAMLPVLGTAFVIMGGCAKPPLGAEIVLRVTPMQELGRLSYGWYLWHWPILVIAPYVLGQQLSTPAKAGLMLLALVPASISMSAVEDPLRFHPVLRSRVMLGLLLGTSLTAVAAALALIAMQLPTPEVRGTRRAASTAETLGSGNLRSGELAKLIRTSSTAKALPADLKPSLSKAATDYQRDGNCPAPDAARTVTYNIGMGCEHRGVDSVETTVVLLGDSHAAHWFDALDVVAQQQRWRLVVFTKVGCTPATATLSKGKTGAPFTECDDWRKDALRRIGELRPAMVVMSSLTYQDRPLGTTGNVNGAWGQAWLTTINAVKEAGSKPVIIEDTPFPEDNVPDCLAAHASDIERCNLERKNAINQGREQVIAGIAAENGAKVVDSTPWFCGAAACPAVIGDVLVYRDNSHVTATYSRLLGELLSKQLVP